MRTRAGRAGATAPPAPPAARATRGRAARPPRARARSRCRRRPPRLPARPGVGQRDPVEHELVVAAGGGLDGRLEDAVARVLQRVVAALDAYEPLLRPRRPDAELRAPAGQRARAERAQEWVSARRQDAPSSPTAAGSERWGSCGS